MNDILGAFTSADVEGLTALIDRLEQSSFDFMKLEGEGISITIGKNGFCDDAAPAAPAPVVVAAPAAPAAPVEEVAAPAPVEAAPAVPAAPVVSEEKTYIRCTSYGMFYAQSEPGAPAYVKVGDHVNVGDTVGLLEIMKTYTAITADVAGTITEVLVNNQDAVEPDQPLFAIKAD